MRLGNAENLVAFMAAKAFHKRELQRIQPEFGCVIVTRNVYVRRLQSVSHVKEKAVAAFA